MSPVVDAWSEAGETWMRAVSAAIAPLQERNSALHVRQGVDGNDIFALRAWASFARGGVRGDEDLVISLDVKSGTDGFRIEADIARGDGEVLALSAARTIAPVGDDELLRAHATEAITELVAFLSAHADLLASELAPERP